ncbi:MAG: response regulator [Planctomycetota bacterium]|nr:response regulator [Planctomycetota bacterium]
MRPTHVLVADDSRTLRTHVRRTLIEAGFEVEIAEDGIQALQRIRERCPAVAIVDINMPGTDGFGVLGSLKAMGHPFDALPIILLTRDQSQALETLGAQVGAFLHKPVSPRVLVETVANLTTNEHWKPAGNFSTI